MLAFSRTVEKEGSIMGYRDHQSHDHVYLLPLDAKVVRDGQGRPAFSLLGYAGQYAQGWRLTLRLRLDIDEVNRRPEDEETNETLVVSHLPVDRAWIRLRFVIPTEEGQDTLHSPWYETRVIGGEIRGVALELDKDQGGLLESLLSADDLPVEALSMEVKMTYRGLRATFPVRFSFLPFDFEKSMRAKLATLFPEDEDEEDGEAERPIPRATLLELHTEWLTTQTPKAFSPALQGADQSVMEEVSLRLLEAGWEQTETDRFILKRLTEWTDLLGLNGDGAAMETVRLSWDLRVPVIGEGRWEGIWRFSEFWNALEEEEREDLFPRVPVPAPMKPMPIHITSTIPVDTHQVRKIIVKLHYVGTSQSWEDHEVVFEGPEQMTSTNWAIVPRGEPFSYYYGLEAFFGIPERGGWPPPPIRLGLHRTDNPYIALTPSTFSFSFLRLEVQGDAFDGIGRVEVQLITIPEEEGLDEPKPPVQESIWLTRTLPDRFVLIDQHEGARFRLYRILVHPPEGVDAGPVVTLDKTPITTQRILVTAFYTQVVRPDVLRIAMVTGDDFPAAHLLVRLKAASAPPDSEGELFLLDEQRPEAFWAIWRPDLFTPLAYQWKTEIHFREGSGREPLVGDWTEGQARELVFDFLPLEG